MIYIYISEVRRSLIKQLPIVAIVARCRPLLLNATCLVQMSRITWENHRHHPSFFTTIRGDVSGVYKMITRDHTPSRSELTCAVQSLESGGCVSCFGESNFPGIRKKNTFVAQDTPTLYRLYSSIFTRQPNWSPGNTWRTALALRV